MITEAKVKKIVDQAITAAVPQIIEAMQPAQQVNTAVDDDEISMDPCYQDTIAAKRAIMNRIAKGERSRTTVRNSNGSGYVTDNNLKDLDTVNRELKSMRSGNHTQFMR